MVCIFSRMYRDPMWKHMGSLESTKQAERRLGQLLPFCGASQTSHVHPQGYRRAYSLKI